MRSHPLTLRCLQRCFVSISVSHGSGLGGRTFPLLLRPYVRGRYNSRTSVHLFPNHGSKNLNTSNVYNNLERLSFQIKFKRNVRTDMLHSPLLACNLRKRLKCPRFETVGSRRNIGLKRCFFFTKKSTQPQRGLSAVHLELLKPEVVLSEKNRRSFVEKFKSPKPARVQENVSHASVLVPLCMHQGELGFLYTLRSTKVNSNRGQVSFPGGMHDKEDRSLEETALRETWEELKIPRSKIDVWAAGNLIDKQKIKVLPVFGYIGEINPEKLTVNAEEVGEAFFVSLRKLCDPTLCRYTQFRDGYSLPVYLGGKHRIWGFTGAITHMILSVLVPDVYKQQFVYLRNVAPEKERSIRR